MSYHARPATSQQAFEERRGMHHAALMNCQSGADLIRHFDLKPGPGLRRMFMPDTSGLSRRVRLGAAVRVVVVLYFL